MKKYISLLLSVLLMFSLAGVSFAQTQDSGVLLELKGLGIVTDEKPLDEVVTRGEFAELVTAILNMKELAEQIDPTDRYGDVAIQSSYAKPVALLSRLGILNGVGECKFAPDDGIYLNQAVKMLVYCTGYDMVAGEKGGWPGGYLSVGASIGLLKNVQAHEPLTRADVYQLLYNALTVELLQQSFGEPGDTLVKSGDTLRSILMNGSSSENIYDNIFTTKGVMEANAYSYIGSPVSDLSDREVVIDSVIYDVGETNAADFFGQKVEFFATETERGYMLLSIRAVSEQKVVTLDAEDVSGKIGNRVLYTNESDKELDIALADMPKVVYNGTRVVYPEDSLYQFENGTLTFIDHNGDKKAEVVVLEEYENVVAKSYSNGYFMFRNDCFYRGSNSLYVDPDDDTKKLMVVDGSNRLVEEFHDDKIVSIFADLGGSRYRIVVSDKIITGTLESIFEEELFVDGVSYNYDKSIDFSTMLGEEATFFVNFNNEIVFSKSGYIPRYGYILGLARKDALSPLKVRLLTAGQVDFGVDINVEDVNDTSQVPYLISQNDAVTVLECAEKVNFNGSSYRGNLDSISSRLLYQAVSYRVNAEGKISRLELAEQDGGDANRRSKYNVYEMVFGGSEYIDGFAINQDTRVICVPNDPSSDDDCMVKVKIDVANNATGYLVTGHDFDESNKKVRLLVIHSEMDSEQVRTVGLTSSRASVVRSVVNRYNEETGETETVIEILTDDTVYTLKPLESLDVSSLQKGDVLAYLTNTNDKLENILVFESLTRLRSDMHVSSRDNYTETFGSVTAISRDDIDSLNNILVTNMTLCADGVEYLFRIPQRNKPSVYLYQSHNNTVEPALLTDIIPGQDKVYVLERSGDSYIRAVVIVR